MVLYDWWKSGLVVLILGGALALISLNNALYHVEFEDEETRICTFQNRYNTEKKACLILPPETEVITLQSHRNHATLLACDGQIWHFDTIHSHWTRGQIYTIPDRIVGASISACGSIVLIRYQEDRECNPYVPDQIIGVMAFCDGQLVKLYEPHNMQDCVDIYCHPEGQTWGFTYTTIQDYDMFYGSCGDRHFGAILFDRDGVVLRHTWSEHFGFDHHPTGLWWGSGLDPLIRIIPIEKTDSAKFYVQWGQADPKEGSPEFWGAYYRDLQTLLAKVVPMQEPQISSDGKVIAFSTQDHLGVIILREFPCEDLKEFLSDRKEKPLIIFGDEILAISLQWFPDIVWIDVRHHIHRIDLELLLWDMCGELLGWSPC